MPHTHCSYTPNGSHVPVPEPNPDLSVCLNTTGGDYAAFLDGVLNHKVLTPALIAESEKDATPGAMMGEGYTLYGHYGFAAVFTFPPTLSDDTAPSSAAQPLDLLNAQAAPPHLPAYRLAQQPFPGRSNVRSFHFQPPGFGHFLECFDSYRGYTLECKRAQVHCDPGAFGYYPLMDRRYGYWMQITAYEHGASYPRSGIPEACRYGSRTPE